jgi:hypothetical protein
MKGGAMARPKKSAVKKVKSAAKKKKGEKVYTLEVLLVQGIVSQEFADANPIVSRTIEIRGKQTLEDLHFAIFDAFDRYDEHMYEFNLGTKPRDYKGPSFVMPEIWDVEGPFDDRMVNSVDQATIDSMGLKVRGRFFYWFDFGDDWWHKITVKAIDADAPPGRFPKVVNRVGASPPQYLDFDEEEGDSSEEEE